MHCNAVTAVKKAVNTQ